MDPQYAIIQTLPNLIKRMQHRMVALFSFLYHGRTKRCNICEKNFRKMHATGPTRRPHAICPSCYSTESSRVLWFYLNDEILGLKTKRNFLYFEPEEPILRKLQNYPINITTAPIDLFFTQHNERWELKGYPFDVIILQQQLQYVPDDIETLKTLYRMLRPGGIAIVTTIVNRHMERTYDQPETEEDIDRLGIYFEPGMKRVFGRDVKKRLAKSGFQVTDIDYAELLGESASNYYSLGNGDREIIYICRKF